MSWRILNAYKCQNKFGIYGLGANVPNSGSSNGPIRVPEGVRKTPIPAARPCHTQVYTYPPGLYRYVPRKRPFFGLFLSHNDPNFSVKLSQIDPPFH